MNRTIRVLVADDHAVVRAGIRDLLELESDLTVVGEACNGYEALERTLSQKPDVVLMDISMPLLCGLEATRRIRLADPKVRILVLTAHEDGEHLRALLAAGANGYLLKTADELDLQRAIRAVVAGHVVIDPLVTQHVFAYLQGGTQLNDALSERERTVLCLTARGLTNKQIAQTLQLSARTVQNHLANIYAKLDVASRTEAVTVGLRRNLIQLDAAA